MIFKHRYLGKFTYKLSNASNDEDSSRYLNRLRPSLEKTTMIGKGSIPTLGYKVVCITSIESRLLYAYLFLPYPYYE